MSVSTTSSSKKLWNDKYFWYAEFAAIVTRALFLFLTAGMTKSADAYAWVNVGKILFSGGNPYALTAQLNYPPFWMQVIYVLEKISYTSSLSFITCLILLLIAIELTLIAALYILLQVLMPDKSSGRFLIWAISLNPICIILTCQHGNFDGLVALSVVLFVIAIVSYQQSADPTDWLIACVLLGIAILIKTTPFVLAPLLFIGAAKISRKTLLLGSALTVAPVLLGLSIIYVLAPIGVRNNVIAYRSIAGYFGFTSILGFLHLSAFIPIYARVFPIVIATSMFVLAFWLYKLPEQSERLSVFMATGSMLALPIFGPGYGPQYLFWSIPLLAAIYYLTNNVVLQRTFLIAYVISVSTYLIEYSFFASHGALAIQIWPESKTLKSFATNISTQSGQTLIRFPMFLALLAVFFMVMREVRRMSASPINFRHGQVDHRYSP